MTCVEMRTEAELLYESINSSDAPGFISTEWDQFLTIAQRRVVRRILTEGINRNAFNQLAIERLVQRDSYTAFEDESHFKHYNGDPAQKLDVVVPPAGAKVFNVKYFWILDEYVQTGTGGTLVNNIPLKRITYDFYRTNIKNPFRIPSPEEGYWVLQYNNAPVFITDGVDVTGYYVIGVEHPDNYPIGPATPANDCILNESVHSDIVEEAVKLARMSVSDQAGYQLAAVEFAK